MAKYVFALCALFFVYSAPNVSCAETELQSLIVELYKKIEEIAGTLSEENQQNLEAFIAKHTTVLWASAAIHEKLIEIYKETSDSECEDLLNKLNETAIAKVTGWIEKIDDFSDASDMTSEEFAALLAKLESKMSEGTETVKKIIGDVAETCDVTITK